MQGTIYVGNEAYESDVTKFY